MLAFLLEINVGHCRGAKTVDLFPYFQHLLPLSRSIISQQNDDYMEKKTEFTKQYSKILRKVDHQLYKINIEP